MLKFILMAVFCAFAVPAYAEGYDISTKNIANMTPVTALDADDYVHIYDTATGDGEVTEATSLMFPLQAAISLGASVTLDNATYAGRELCFGSVIGTATLPAATGSGAVYRFNACAVPPTTGYVITVTGDDTIDGQVTSTQDSGDTVVGWETAANTDTITFTSSTRMGASIGAWVELIDVGADQWTVKGQGVSTGSEVTPFSGS